MATPSTTTSINASSARVFEVISDPTTYPDWLIGAQGIRKVDPDWPAPGSSFHHRVGVGPLHVADRTTVLHVHEPKRLSLRAHIGPVGSADVTFVLRERDGATQVELDERPSDGLLNAVWFTVGRPLLAFGMWGRNDVSLSRLKTYIEAGADDGEDDSGNGPLDNRRASDTADPDQ